MVLESEYAIFISYIRRIFYNYRDRRVEVRMMEIEPS